MSVPEQIRPREKLIMLRMTTLELFEGAHSHRSYAEAVGISEEAARIHNSRYLKMASIASMSEDSRKVLAERLERLLKVKI